ncbi:MAG TPA: helix-turn-helix domain-containing protein, partial [Anaerolineales bacterium]|nr:helix-turn-helix domain-containing protein [Anaerolineales bacterium]
MDSQPQVLAFVKAMADAERLRIIGALTRGPQTLTALAGQLGIHPSETNRHIEQLIASDVLREANGQYSINEKALESIAREQFGNQRETYLP